MRIGLIGCGMISRTYLEHARRFPILKVVACADLDALRSKQLAEQFQIARSCSVEKLLAASDVELVLNLTVPHSHAPVSLAAIEAGKHIYSEKPLATTLPDATRIMEVAAAQSVRVGCAPDTFLGAGHQTARALIDDGAIGRPVAALGFMLSEGIEQWHPNPHFFYEPGGGPLMDMGPYYVTDLMQLMGAAQKVSGSAIIAIGHRTIQSKPHRGEVINVQTPDHVAGSILFESGALATIVTSFAAMKIDIWPITIFGTEGTLKVPDPNGFDGDVVLARRGETNWAKIDARHPTGFGRAVGLAEMAYAIRSGRSHRASGQQALAAVEVMLGLLDSAQRGQAVEMAAAYERPAPLPTDWPRGEEAIEQP